MTNALWFLLIGLLMLTRGLSKPLLERLPFTLAMVYLSIGFLLGPSVLNLFYFDPIKQSALLETLTEIAILISLFSAGVKMPVPFKAKNWQLPFRLASVSMAMTVGLIAAFSYGLERIMKYRNRAILQFRLQINHQIAATEDI